MWITFVIHYIIVSFKLGVKLPEMDYMIAKHVVVVKEYIFIYQMYILWCNE